MLEMELSKECWHGILHFLDIYAKANPNDAVVIGYSPECKLLYAALAVACKLKKLKSYGFGFQPVRDQRFSENLAKINDSVECPEENKIILLTLELHTRSHEEKLVQFINNNPDRKVLVFQLMNACEDLFGQALITPPETINSINNYLINKLSGKRIIRISSELGTDLEVEFHPKYRWLSNRGMGEVNKITHLPSGEVATYPANLNGIFVANFAINVNLKLPFDARIGDTPVTLHIRNNKVEGYNVNDHTIHNFLERCFKVDNCNLVGEFGIGTNIGIHKPISLNSQINERTTGLHLGFGQHNQSLDLVKYTCPIHLDLISNFGVIDTGNEQIDLETLNELDLSNIPTSMHVEEGDCCGEKVIGKMNFLSSVR